MDDFSRPRREMVERALRVPLTAVFEPAASALAEVPRHAFVEKALWHKAYSEAALPIGRGQTISAPAVVLACLSALSPRRDELLLEVGSGSGYTAAVASRMCSRVYGVEVLLDLVHSSRKVLQTLGYSNILVQYGNGGLGWPENAPFDCILLSAACRVVPDGLFAQLAEGGRLGAPVGGPDGQEFRVWKKRGGAVEDAGRAFSASFVPLVQSGA